ncbi:hypothetical protein N7450_003047 [Penicillium hetheringtonii]|uniref:Uncharacterized protein n=1 Tax=Penicillium hetheringtonii TaxID=911720 RepID=A0AAD6GZZ2_9EURO|nr:hypothetical protein N7450_003047 [Penicillium hetheringtonii]
MELYFGDAMDESAHGALGHHCFCCSIAIYLLLIPIPEPEPVAEGEKGKDNQQPAGPRKFLSVPQLPSLPEIHLPSFRPPSHEAPPEQTNSTSGESKWFSNWEWLNPFSSAITLEEDRSVLPPLQERRAIYTYYNPKYNPKKFSGNAWKDNQKADAELLVAWRRAWYAQGFRPVVLGPGDAMKNPHYELCSAGWHGVTWEQVYFPILHVSLWHATTMNFFPLLRRGTEPEVIIRFENFQGGLFSAEKHRIDEAIDVSVKKLADKSTSLSDLMPVELFKVQQPSALAYYKGSSINSRYPEVHEKISQNPANGRSELVKLINAHLHNTFQNAYPAGLAVLKPFPQHTTALVEPALRLAKALIQCPESPMPGSCPPNLPECRPCGSAKQPMRISQPASFKNTPFLFTIGTLPHPYTLITLQKSSEDITVRSIRRETERDPWVTDVTRDNLGEDGQELSASYRGVMFKQFVAGEQAVANSLWMTVESLPAEAGQSLPSELLDEFEWQFGFKIPRTGTIDPNTAGDKESVQDKTPSQQGVSREYDLIKKAREAIKSQDPNHVNIKAVSEAWNMADTEVWRFVKAYRARSVVERKQWQEEEKKFASSSQ